jgi:hypothetical protein
MHLPSLTDEELLSYFRATRNDLTTTALEEDLARRLAALLDEIETLKTDNLENDE